MGKGNFSTSSYYPPRASLWSPLRYFVYELKETVSEWNYRIENRQSATKISLLPLLIPGFGFLYAGKPKSGRISFVLYLVCLIWFFVEIGFKEANYAFAFMVFLHSVNIIFYLSGFLGRLSLKSQIFLNLAISVVIVPSLYYLFLSFLNLNVLAPFKYRDSVIVVLKFGDPQSARIGDLIAYNLEGDFSRGQYYIIGGLNVGKVIAKGEEKITFTPNFVITKHGYFLKPVYYPESLEIVTPANSVFVLTELNLQGNLTAEIRHLIVNQSIINEDRYAGFVPRTWFGRRQYY